MYLLKITAENYKESLIIKETLKEIFVILKKLQDCKIDYVKEIYKIEKIKEGGKNETSKYSES